MTPTLGAAGTPVRPDLRDEDLTDILTTFYERVGMDTILSPYFADLNMTAHMPRITGFWSTLLFHTARYSGNAFLPHQKMPGLAAEHFARWVSTMESVIDVQFAGDNAEQMKALAHRIAYSMQLRLGIHPFAAFQPSIDPPSAG